MNNKLLNEIMIFAIIPIITFLGLSYWTYTIGLETKSLKEEYQTRTADLQTQKSKLEQVRQENAQKANVKKKESISGKVIYEVLDQQFSSDASFGVMFESLLSNITGNGLKIHSIDYNYELQDDRVIMTGLPGYNACELTFTTVSTYTQLQNFLKSIVKEKHLINIYEIYIEPYDKDKTILVTKFKIRLYTKTVRG